MAWTPAYNAKGAEPLIRQLLAIINRDIQAALDFVSGAPGSLRPFATYQLAESPTLNYPAVLMVAPSLDFDPETVGIAAETTPVFCAVAVDDDDPNRVAIKVQQYAMAVWHVLTAAWIKSGADFEASDIPLPLSAYPAGGNAPGLPQGTLNRLFVRKPNFDELQRTPKSMFVKAASLLIEADLFEN
jgi:hypothetical protein